MGLRGWDILHVLAGGYVPEIVRLNEDGNANLLGPTLDLLARRIGVIRSIHRSGVGAYPGTQWGR